MSPSNYDVAMIEGMRRKNKSWQSICEHYSVQYPAAYRWYKRQLKAKDKLSLDLKKKTLVGVSRALKKKALQYKPPTGYISTLNHTEWVNKYCPGHSWDLEYLTNISELLWNGFNEFAYLPRGHGKTLRVIGLFCRYLLEVRKPILCITGGPANQRRIWNSVRRICNSKIILEDYGNCFANWNGQLKEAEFVDEIPSPGIDPAFAIVTRMGEIVGRHPAWIHLEDIIQEPFRSHESNVFLQQWFIGIVEFCATHEIGQETRITGTGTRKTIDDFYGYLETELRYKPYVEESVTLLDGEFPSIAEVYIDNITNKDRVIHDPANFETLNCPKWPLETLLLSRIISPLKFEAEMQNHPLPATGTYFDPTDMMFYNSLEDCPAKNTTLAIHCDPSFGRKAGSDFTCINVVGWQKTTDRFYVLEHFLKRSMTYNDIIEQIIETYIRYSTLGYPIRSITIENNLYQMWLLDGIVGIPIPVEGLDSQANKIERIASILPVFKKHMLFFNENLPGFRQVLAQITQFDQTPSTATKKDDFLDALHACIMRLQIVLHRPGKSWSQL